MAARSTSIADTIARLQPAVWCEIDLLEFSVRPSDNWSVKDAKWRMCGYLVNAAKRVVHESVSLSKRCWRDVVSDIVRSSLRAYCSACGSKTFFPDIDLRDALLAAAESVLPALAHEHVPSRVLDHAVSSRVEQYMEDYHLHKTVWHALKLTFPELTEKKMASCYTVLLQAFRLAESVSGSDSQRRRLPRPVHVAHSAEDDAICLFLQTWILRCKHQEPVLEFKLHTLFFRMVCLTSDMPRSSRRCLPKLLRSGPRDWQQLLSRAMLANEPPPLHASRAAERDRHGSRSSRRRKYHRRATAFRPKRSLSSCSDSKSTGSSVSSSSLPPKSKQQSSQSLTLDIAPASKLPGQERGVLASASIPDQLVNRTDFVNGVTSTHQLNVSLSLEGHPQCSSAFCIGTSGDRVVVRHQSDYSMETYCLTCWRRIVYKSTSRNAGVQWTGSWQE